MVNSIIASVNDPDPDGKTEKVIGGIVYRWDGHAWIAVDRTEAFGG